MGEDAVVYEKERPRQRGSNRDEIVVLVVLLFWRGDIAGQMRAIRALRGK
jgi:hypothetical protein